MAGIAKSSRGVRMAPRSRPTTLSPALVSSRDRMLPVQPMPMTTASTSLSFVTIAAPLREVRNRLRFLVVFLVVVGLDLVAITGRQTGKADHLPRHLVLVAAIHRIGEEPFLRQRQKRIEEQRAAETGEFRLAFLHGLQRLFALLRRQAVEFLAIGFLGPFIGRFDAGAVELAWCERQLIAQLGLCRQEGALPIEPRAIAEAARELAVDETRQTDIRARRRQLVGRNERIHGGL